MELTPEQDRLATRILFWGGWTMLIITLILVSLGVFHDFGIVLAVVSLGITVVGTVRGASQKAVREVKEGVSEVKGTMLEMKTGIVEVRDGVAGLQAGQSETNRLLRSIDGKLPLGSPPPAGEP